MKKEENPDALKHLFGKTLLKKIGSAIKTVYPEFDLPRFTAGFSAMEKLEMKPRVRFLRDELKGQLPEAFPKALKILLASLKKGDLEGFDLWPYTEFVQTYGLDHLELSLSAMKKLTPRFTSEFAVRPFLIRHPEKTMKFLNHCAGDSDEHVRRWASEGSRPRLPWGERLQDFVRDPSPTLALLEKLKFDEELYVRKSVSNHLNDVTKDHPKKVVELLARWKKEAGEKHAKKIDWIIHRSLRSLIKAGDSDALKLIGVSTDAKVTFSKFEMNRKKFRIGDRIDFSFEMTSRSTKPQKLVIDYVLHFMRANGKLSPKVFKLKSLTLAGNASVRVAKTHSLKQITTRVFYPGTHVLQIQGNGIVMNTAKWELTR